MPSPRPHCHLVQRPHNEARRAVGHALGVRYTPLSTIPGNAVYRVRRRRVAEARSELRLVSIATLCLFLDVFEIVKHFLHIIADGQHGARDGISTGFRLVGIRS